MCVLLDIQVFRDLTFPTSKINKKVNGSPGAHKTRVESGRGKNQGPYLKLTWTFDLCAAKVQVLHAALY